MAQLDARSPSLCGAVLSRPLLALSGIALVLPFFYNADAPVTIPLQLLLAAGSFGLVLLFPIGGAAARWSLTDGRIIAVAMVVAALLAYTAAAIWPISGDEYGYLYLADTLLHGRFYNPPPPVPDLFDFFWMGMRDGRTASQYPPGWPVFLALFRALNLAQLANPVLVGALGWLLAASMKRLGVEPGTRLPLLALILLSPFTLFNGASLFSHMLAAVATAGICYLQIRDDAVPRFWHKLGIGALMSVVLVTRHDCFLILAPLFALDRLILRRAAIVRDAAGFALGGLPISLLLLFYNWQITGSPLLTTMLWAAPAEQTFGTGGLAFFISNFAKLLGLLFVFSGVLLAALFLLALRARLGMRSVRFYDLLFPAAVLFFLFYPHDAGHQFGPRYYYFAWPTIALTIGPVVSAAGGRAGLGRAGTSLQALATSQLYVFLGFVIGFAPFVRLYAEARQLVFAAVPSETPAIVLVPPRKFTLSPVQSRYFYAYPRDFTRNGLDFSRPVLYGRADEERFPKLACSMTGYHVYLWQEQGLQKLDCTAQR